MFLNDSINLEPNIFTLELVEYEYDKTMFKRYDSQHKQLPSKQARLTKKRLNHETGFSRRRFLRESLLSSVFVPLFGCGGGSSDNTLPPITVRSTPGELSQAQTTQSILIIGAGLSGLVAAYELSRAGHQVTLLEARERSGGRVHTINLPFSNGQFAEAGASRIPSNHNLTHGYCDHFSLARDPFYPNTERYFEIAAAQASFIDANSYINQPPWQGSVNRSAYSKIRGGMSLLPTSFADQLSNSIIYSQAVESVTQSNSEVSVTTQDGSRFQAERLLCTVPLPVLANIEFTPSLSVDKISAANGGYNYTDSSRLYSQFDSRFWLEQNLNGWGNSDHPEEIWQPTWDNDQESGILQSYLRGSVARDFDQLMLDQQVAQIHQRIATAIPAISDFTSSNFVFSWANESWSGSAYASPTSSQASQLSAAIAESEGRIHFCGEHASNFHGWIQEALESGIRAEQEIHNSV